MIELVKRAYLFSESYRVHGLEGFSTGSMNKEYTDLLQNLDRFKLENLDLDSEKLKNIFEPNILKIAQIYSNKDLNIGLIFIPKDR